MTTWHKWAPLRRFTNPSSETSAPKLNSFSHLTSPILALKSQLCCWKKKKKKNPDWHAGIHTNHIHIMPTHSPSPRRNKTWECKSDKLGVQDELCHDLSNGGRGCNLAKLLKFPVSSPSNLSSTFLPKPGIIKKLSVCEQEVRDRFSPNLHWVTFKILIVH